MINYIHRVGRTGRAGQSGNAVSFFTDEDRPLLRGLGNMLKISVNLILFVDSLSPKLLYCISLIFLMISLFFISLYIISYRRVARFLIGF